MKRFDYVVMGDGDTHEGLAAPYDEETTESVLKIERCEAGDLFEFWQNNANTDQFSSKNPERQEFGK